MFSDWGFSFNNHGVDFTMQIRIPFLRPDPNLQVDVTTTPNMAISSMYFDNYPYWVFDHGVYQQTINPNLQDETSANFVLIDFEATYNGTVCQLPDMSGGRRMCVRYGLLTSGDLGNKRKCTVPIAEDCKCKRGAKFDDMPINDASNLSDY